MSIFKKISISFKSFSTAHRFIKQHRLWHFVLIPGVLNAVLFFLSWRWLRKSMGDWIEELLSVNCSDVDGVMGWMCDAYNFVIDYVDILIHFAFVWVWLMIYKNFILLIYSPVIAYLVEVVEQKDKGIDIPFSMEQFLKDVVRGIVIAARNILLESICVLALLIMGLVPVINLIQPVLLWLVSAYFFGFSMLDYSLERKRMNAKSSINYIKRHKSLATGIGSVFQLIYIIPFVGWMFAPTYSAVAAYFTVEEMEKLDA